MSCAPGTPAATAIRRGRLTPAVEPAAGEPAPDARRAPDSRARSRARAPRRRCVSRLSLRSRSAASFCSRTVVVRVAGEADRVEQGAHVVAGGPRRPPVDGQVGRGEVRHDPGEVGRPQATVMPIPAGVGGKRRSSRAIAPSRASRAARRSARRSPVVSSSVTTCMWSGGTMTSTSLSRTIRRPSSRCCSRRAAVAAAAPVEPPVSRSTSS